jgi:cephalosporin hydroxylase
MGFKILQLESEIAEFIEIVRKEGVTSYLEIGSCWGGTLDRIVRAMPKGSRAVAVDLPTKRAEETLPSLERIAQALRTDGYNVTVIVGDSTDNKTISRVRLMAPFDLLFIDANHTEPYVRKDWANYGKLAEIVAFHDANDTKVRDAGRLPIEVKPVWDEMKAYYPHREIFHEEKRNGIGVLWRT